MKLLLCFITIISPFIVFADSSEDLAYKYAPVIFQQVDNYYPRLDFISGVDFDGDMVGNNNWDNIFEHKLKPVVYFAIVSTESHHFLTYSIFHPRDWTTWCTGWFFECHENDMENIQVVVDKKSEEVVALVTQAHFWSYLYFRQNTEGEYGQIMFVDKDGTESETGRAGIFVKSKGHAIYGLDRDNQYIEDAVIYYPDKSQSNIEPVLDDKRHFSYKLESTLEKFWIPILDGKLYGEGKLFNKVFNYQDPEIAWEYVPRHFDSDMYSGIGKKSAGIVPFAMGFSLFAADIGGLFFNPAYHFKQSVDLASSWSQNYTYHPYK